MTAADHDRWVPIQSLPERPLLLTELPEVASQFDGDTAMWIEINADETKRDFEFPDVGEELISNFAVLTDDGAYQYRFDADHWMSSDPVQSVSGLSTIASAAGSDWMGFDHLQDRVRAATTAGDTIPVEIDEYRSASDWNPTSLLPPRFATASDLTYLKTLAKQAYGGKVTVWVETGLMEFYREHADITDLGQTRVRCVTVETADAYYRFEFDVIEQTWREIGPVDPVDWEYEPPGDSGFTALEQLVVSDVDDQYWWAATESSPEVTVAIADLNPYSTVHMGPSEKRAILDALDERLDDLASDHSEDDPWYESVVSLRATVRQAVSTLCLSVEEHDRLINALRRSSAEAPLRRLRRVEPECDVGCAASGYQQIQIDGGEVYTVCNDCKAAIVGPGGRVPVLRQLDPRITPDHDVTIEWPDTEELNPTQQADLDDFC